MDKLTILCMVLICISAACILGYKERLVDDKPFLSIDDSKVIRGLIATFLVIINHTPERYQNTIQDMIGSFGYIGITFFFITSAYGLSLSVKKDRRVLNTFWRRRLLTILIPQLFANIISFFVNIAIHGEWKFITLITVDIWVINLLICYVIFWVANKYFSKFGIQDYVVCFCVLLFSLAEYFSQGYTDMTVWPTELIGFIYGVIFANCHKKINGFLKRNWIRNCVVSCVLSLMLGVGYLKFKPVHFWGDYILKIALGAAILGFMFSVLSKIKIGNKAGFILGSISFEIYLLHGVAYSLLEKYYKDIPSGVFIILSIILAIVIAYIVYLIAEFAINYLKKKLIYQ